MKALIAGLLISTIALPASAEETCADAPPDVTGESVCLEQGEPAPFRARALSFPEHLRREKVNARNADLWDGITKGDAVVVSKPVFFVVVAGGAAAVVAAIMLGIVATTRR